MTIKEAHFNMIEQQIRTWDVLDPMVLELLTQEAREDFVPEAYQGLAYADLAIPLDHGEVMMHPVVEARMLQALELHPTDKVLEIGTGSGYVTSLLAHAVHHVTSVEIHEGMSKAAGARLKANGIKNVELQVGDASRGWGGDALYDIIVVTASTPVLADAFRMALNRGGRLFAVIGQSPLMEATLIRRTDENDWEQRALFETDVPALVNAPQPAGFVF